MGKVEFFTSPDELNELLNHYLIDNVIIFCDYSMYRILGVSPDTHTYRGFPVLIDTRGTVQNRVVMI